MTAALCFQQWVGWSWRVLIFTEDDISNLTPQRLLELRAHILNTPVYAQEYKHHMNNPGTTGQVPSGEIPAILGKQLGLN